MAQQDHLTVGPTASDITANLSAGCYVAQPGGLVGVLYATRATAPTDDEDYFRCRPLEFFTFTVGGGASPTWVKSELSAPAPVALALVPAS